MNNTTYILHSWDTDAHRAVRRYEGRLHYWMAYGLLLRQHCEGLTRSQLQAMRDHVQRARNLLGEDHDESYYYLDSIYEKVMSIPLEGVQPDGKPGSESGAEWYYAVLDKIYGPLTWDDLRLTARNGELRPGDMVWSTETPYWICASAKIEFFDQGS